MPIKLVPVAVQGGITLSEICASDPATGQKIGIGYTALDIDGNPISVALDASVQATNVLLNEIALALDPLATEATQVNILNDLVALSGVVGNPADVPYNGNGNSTVVAGIKGIVAKLGSVVLGTGAAVIGAVTQSGSWVFSPPAVTPVDHSVSIAAAGAGASSLFAANPNRNNITFQVPSALPGGIFLSWSGAAGNGTPGSYFFPGGTQLVTLDRSVVGLGAITYYVPFAPGSPVELPATEG